MFCVICLSQANAQITIIADPDEQEVDCQAGVDPLNHPSYLSWLSNNGGGLASSPCGIITPWTISSVEFDESDNGCYAGSINVIWEIHDSCGSNIEEASGFFYINSESPTFSIAPSNLFLDCGSPQNTTTLQNWMDNFGGAIATDDCSSSSELLITIDTFGLYALTCDNAFLASFWLQDSCQQYPSPVDYSAIFMVSTKVGFSNYYTDVSEGSPTASLCIETTEAALDAPLDVEVILSTSSTATNGVDYELLDTEQTFTIPAGPIGVHCFDINILEDQLVEDQEYIEFEITAVNSSLNEADINHNDITRINIEDNDDNDNDGIENSIDNCPDHANSNQEDIDGDGMGNPCDNANIVSQLHIVEDNIFLDKIYSGMIVRSPNGSCWMITVSDTGGVSTISVVCPN